MKTIKKVSVSPIPQNEASVIDSLNTTDDKHTNTYSINALETTRTATGSATGTSDITYNVTWKRNMNIVSLKVDVEIPQNLTSADGAYLSFNSYGTFMPSCPIFLQKQN